MNNSLIVCFLFSLIIAGIHCQQSCGVLRPRTCGRNECCLLPFLGFCAPLRRENQRCGLLHCPCAPGLQCMKGRGLSILGLSGICVRAISTTTTQSPSTLTDTVTDITGTVTDITGTLTDITGTVTDITDIVTDITDILPLTTRNTAANTETTPTTTTTTTPPTNTTTTAST